MRACFAVEFWSFLRGDGTANKLTVYRDREHFTFSVICFAPFASTAFASTPFVGVPSAMPVSINYSQLTLRKNDESTYNFGRRGGRPVLLRRCG